MPRAVRRASSSVPRGRQARRRRRPCRRSIRFCAASAASRRSVSRKKELPPSTTMSPGSSRGASSVSTASTGTPAFTIRMICRGLASAATSSGSVGDTGNSGVRGRSREVFLGTQGGAVIDDQRKSIAGDVEGEILAHHRQPNQPDVWSLLIHAGGLLRGSRRCADITANGELYCSRQARRPFQARARPAAGRHWPARVAAFPAAVRVRVGPASDPGCD